MPFVMELRAIPLLLSVAKLTTERPTVFQQDATNFTDQIRQKARAIQLGIIVRHALVFQLLQKN